MTIALWTSTQALPQVPYARFTGNDPATDVAVGDSVATDGQHILISTFRGSAYLYDPATKQSLAKLTLPDQRPRTSVAIDGNVAVLGTRYGASMFDISDPSQIIQTALEPDDGPHALFGISVDVSGDTIIVGANGDDYAGSFTGSAFLFDIETGQQFAKLIANDGKAGDNFGLNVAIDNDRAVVGAPGAGEEAFDNGKVYLFNTARNVADGRELASYTATLLPSSTGPLNFGYNVDIDDDIIIALQTGWRSYLWQTSDQPVALPDSDETRFQFDSICIDDSLAVIGFPKQNRVIVYDLNRSIVGHIVSPESVATDFGASVAVAGNYVVVGAPGTGANGAAYIYQLSDILIPAPSSMFILVLSMSATMIRRIDRRHCGLCDSGN